MIALYRGTSRLSVVGEVEAAVEVGVVCAGKLRQSMLRSAFEVR